MAEGRGEGGMCVPGGVLSYDVDIPEALLTGGEHNLTSHFALVNYQVQRTAGKPGVAEG